MKLSRNLALKIHFVLDQCLPPFLRDARWFMSIPFRLLYKGQAHVFLTFKERAPRMSEQEFADSYRQVEPVLFERETDLNTASIEEIKKNLAGQTVLEVGCGKGLLSRTIAAMPSVHVTATDIIIDDATRTSNAQIDWKEANAESLPFADRSFDTVVCTHTLEHVQRLAVAMGELRRVARRRVVVVVPMQRPYKYTFDLHLNFFPYPFSFLQQVGAPSHATCQDIGGDLLYIEDAA